jgi:hypothetical protein
MMKRFTLFATAACICAIIVSGAAFAQIKAPVAAAWLYMSDDQNYNTVPQSWSQINFKNVDLLYVGPAGIQADGTFGLYDSSKTGNLAYRFKWVIQTARTQNPNIKVIVSQWWGETGSSIWGRPLLALGNSEAAIKKYTDSVAAFLQSYLNVSGGVDGYDIDYESDNIVSYAPTILSGIRSQLNALSKTAGNRPFYVTVSPVRTNFLGNAVASVSFVNMQTYAGGYGSLTVNNFTALGFKSQQLLYGICPESGCTTYSVSQVEAQYTSNKLAGIHLWRLNSDNYPQENQVQAQIYKFLHP